MPRRRFLDLLLLSALLELAACTGEDPARTAAQAEGALRARFPEQATNVLDQGERFERTDSGFSPARRHERGSAALEISLPRAGDQPVRLHGRGLDVRVREVGAAGEGVLAGRAVAYPRVDGAAFWSRTADGYEEWLHFRAGAVRLGAPAAVWTVEGGPLLQDGAAVAVLDAGGNVGIRIAAPAAFAAGGREVAVRLEARGEQIALLVDTDGEEVLVDPAWTTGASLAGPRRQHAAVLLSDGDVLVAGGTGTLPLASVERWDAGTETWTTKASMAVARNGLSATRLTNDFVIVVGGTSGVYQASAEIYDPNGDSWTGAGSMVTARAFHQATLLNDGSVLVTGGTNGVPIAAVEQFVYPATWLTKTPMNMPRQYHTATLLDDGRVLVAGGAGTAPTAEVYDPQSDTWTDTPPMTSARERHAAVKLPDGRVLVAGGRLSGAAVTTSEIYDPGANTWTAQGALSMARYNHAAALLPTGNIIVVAGYDSTFLQSVEVFTPAVPPSVGGWQPGPPLALARNLHTATSLNDGSVLVAGGFNASSLSSVEIFSALGNGAMCSFSVECLSGFCADGVCCDSACAAGPCDACAVAAGAPTDGTCVLLTGAACDDGDLCTQSDTCQAGTCTGMNPVMCSALDTCHAIGVCDPATGVCSNPPAPDGSPCDDSDLCTQSDTCQAGTCTGMNPVACSALDDCHDIGACNPATGACTNPPKPDSTPCAMGACVAGVCVGGSGAPGAPCTGGGDCQSGYCADGVCCDAPCNGVCMACTAAKKGFGINGACGPVPAGWDPDNECQIQLSSCGFTGACDGAGACQKQPGGHVCAKASCNGAVLTFASTCDGNGTCNANGTTDCSPYLCADDASACLTSCSGAADCVPSAYCGAGACTPKKPLGAGCALPKECLSGVCIAGACAIDDDSDGVADANDNCPTVANSAQTNTDGDAQGDACDPDDDNDTVADTADNCPTFPNPLQENIDGNEFGDACDCDNPPKADGTSCDDADACTMVDACQANSCVGTTPFACPQPDPLECKVAVCESPSGICVKLYKVDGAPCPGGQCISGGCLPFDTTGATGGTTGAGGAGTGGGGGGPGGAGGGPVGPAGAGGTGGADTSGAGQGGAEQPRISLYGNGCATGGFPMGTGGAAVWILVGLLFARRRVGFSRLSRGGWAGPAPADRRQRAARGAPPRGARRSPASASASISPWIAPCRRPRRPHRRRRPAPCQSRCQPVRLTPDADDPPRSLGLSR